MYSRAFRLNLIIILLVPGILNCCSRKNQFEDIITSRLEKKDFVDQVTVSGSLEAIKTRSYGCPGIWSDVTIVYLIEEGTHVKEGDTLCIMECLEIENNYRQAVIELENARARYNKSVADLDLQYLLLEAEVKTINASTEITRLDSLQMKFTSPSSREIIRLELQKSELQKNLTLKKLDYLKQINKSELQRMKLMIQQKNNNAERLRSRLDKLTLTADQEGIVLYQVLFTSGEKVREGDVVWGVIPIIKIPDLTGMEVKLEVNESDYKRIATDQTVNVEVDAFPDLRLPGKIKYKAPVGKPVSKGSEVKVFELTVSLDSSSIDLQPGLGVTCDILVNRIRDTIVVPVVSLFEEDSLKMVYIAENSMFIEQAVEVSDNNNREAVVRRGLEGDEVLALVKPPESLVVKSELR